MISSTGGSNLFFMIRGWAEKGRTGGVNAIPTGKFDLHRLHNHMEQSECPTLQSVGQVNTPGNKTDNISAACEPLNVKGG